MTGSGSRGKEYSEKYSKEFVNGHEFSVLRENQYHLQRSDYYFSPLSFLSSPYSQKMTQIDIHRRRSAARTK
jgi:hypothetical protein